MRKEEIIANNIARAGWPHLATPGYSCLRPALPGYAGLRLATPRYVLQRGGVALPGSLRAPYWLLK